MELVKRAVKIGNSAGVILPRKLLGSEIKISVVNEPINPRKESLKLISNDLSDIIGIYVIHTNPIEVLAVSLTKKKVFESTRFKLIMLPISLVRKDLKTNFTLRSKLKKAETILNKLLLIELQKEAKEFI